MPAGKQQKSIKYQIRESVQPTIAPLSAAVSGILAASTLQAATITVTTLNDGLIPGECSLRSALYASTSNTATNSCIAGDSGEDTIEFDAALNGTITLLPDVDNFYYDGSTLPIGESVRIEGDDRITIQGSGAAPAIYAKYDLGGFETEVARINNLTITGGGGDAGGAIRSRAQQLRLSGVTLQDNSVTSRGGAIWHQHPTPVSSSLYVNNSEISGNSVTGSNGRGGGIYARSEAQTLQINNSTLSGNTALGSGGAVDVECGIGFLSVYNSDLGANQSKYGDGGAMNIVAGSSGAARGTVFIARNTNFYDNSATENGGAISILDTGTGEDGFGNIYLQGVYMTGNFAGNEGGATWISRGDGSGTVGNPNNEVTIRRLGAAGRPTLISGNQSANSSGGLHLNVGNATPITITDSEISNNIANSGDGGGALIYGGDSGLAMSDVTFANNTAEGGNGGGLIAEMTSGDIYASRAAFDTNQASVSAGGARMRTAGGSVGLESSQFLNNTATNYGGGLQVYGTPGQIGLGYSIFRGNSAAGGGGIELLVGSENALIEIKYSEVADNIASNYAGGMNLTAGTGSTVFLKNSTVSGNQAQTFGGGLHATGNASLEVKYSTVANNNANGEGGGLYTELVNGCQVSNSVFGGNTGGGGTDGQDLRGGNFLCDVDESLLAGKYSEFNGGTGNILFQDPLLQPLADNGGIGGRTHALGDGSPAIDVGNDGTFTPLTDQRGPGYLRIFGAGLDMGAYEQQPQVDAIFSDRFQSP